MSQCVLVWVWPNGEVTKPSSISSCVVASPQLLAGNPINDFVDIKKAPLIHFRSSPNDWERAYAFFGQKVENAKEYFLIIHFLHSLLLKMEWGYRLLCSPLAKLLDIEHPNNEAFYFVCDKQRSDDPNIKKVYQWLLDIFSLS